MHKSTPPNLEGKARPAHVCPALTATAVLWLRKLGGKLGLTTDRNGPYILLRGLSAVWQTVIGVR